MSLEDDEALFEDLYDDDEVRNEKPQEEVKTSTEVDKKPESASAPAASAAPAANDDDDDDLGLIDDAPIKDTATTTSTDQSSVPPPPPPPPAPQQPQQQQFDPAQFQQFQQYAAANGIPMPNMGVPPPPAAVVPPPPVEQKPATLNKLFLGGLDWQTTEEKLVDYFSKYGEIVDYTIMKDSATGRSRGFGFLTFRDSESVDALLKDKHILDGKLIDPKRAISKEDQEKVGKIFIGGIDPMVNEQEFDEFFSQFGKIIDCQLMIDKDTGRSRGFGFITYDSPAAVDRACVNKYLTLRGKAMEVKRAAPRGQHNQQVMMQQQQQQQAAAAAVMQQQAGMYGGYPGAAAGAAGAVPGAVPGATGAAATAGAYGMMNPAMNQDYMRYYQWYMYQQAQAAAAAQGGSPGGTPEVPTQPLNPQQQQEDDDAADKSNAEPQQSRPNIPTGPKRAPPSGPSYRGRGGGRGGFRRGGRGYHPYGRGRGRY
ncbi:Likely RNA binding protein [Candida maltosa Xu316]|uniref:Likely RNA binding protein n=1 Tax=Candida maltosa (strain Xu316) TaxID=1245528 RepID=M3K339_CANMX|nr:Likely RNA binding protein [Candida maltosa Xu316]